MSPKNKLKINFKKKTFRKTALNKAVTVLSKNQTNRTMENNVVCKPNIWTFDL